jgi:hypothetical protein
MSSDAPFVNRFSAFASGFLAVVLLQAGWGWWLNSGRGVLRTSLVLLVWSMVVAAARQGSNRWDRALAIWLGAISGSMAALFWIGPGTIWPIVLAMAAVLSGVAVIAGTLVGASVRSLWR